jgi:hypothetical protein
MKNLQSVNDVSKILKCSSQHVRNLVSENAINPIIDEDGKLSFKLSDILRYKASLKSTDTLIYIGSADKDSVESLTSLSIDFASLNKLKNINFIDEKYSDLSDDKFLLSKYLVAELCSRKPSNFIIANIHNINPVSIASITESCRINGINLYCFNGHNNTERDF